MNHKTISNNKSANRYINYSVQGQINRTQNTKCEVVETWANYSEIQIFRINYSASTQIVAPVSYWLPNSKKLQFTDSSFDREGGNAHSNNLTDEIRPIT